jgi:hypothetical protein
MKRMSIAAWQCSLFGKRRRCQLASEALVMPPKQDFAEKWP